VEVSESQSLTGGEVLPGFQLSLRDLFVKIGAQEERVMDTGEFDVLLAAAESSVDFWNHPCDDKDWNDTLS
jgi:hypothetical protein